MLAVHEAERPDLYDIAGFQKALLFHIVVDPYPVEGVRVTDDGALFIRFDHGMMAGNRHVVQEYVALRVAPDRELAASNAYVYACLRSAYDSQLAKSLRLRGLDVFLATHSDGLELYS